MIRTMLNSPRFRTVAATAATTAVTVGNALATDPVYTGPPAFADVSAGMGLTIQYIVTVAVGALGIVGAVAGARMIGRQIVRGSAGKV